jgi:hypothetical protein
VTDKPESPQDHSCLKGQGVVNLLSGVSPISQLHFVLAVLPGFGLSVTRVGSAAQTSSMKQVGGAFKIDMAFNLSIILPHLAVGTAWLNLFTPSNGVDSFDGAASSANEIVPGFWCRLGRKGFHGLVCEIAFPVASLK